MPPAPFAIAFLASALLGQTAISPFRQLSLTDRTLQANGVERLIAECDGCPPHLLGIWRTTLRFDVRAHIAQVLERLGPTGLPALIELTRELNVVNDDGQRNLIIRALTPSGPAALEALTTEILEHQPNHSIVFLLPLADAIDVDPAPYARRILAAPTPEARVDAIRHAASALPIVERSQLFLTFARDPDASVRQAATGHPGLPAWLDADRAAYPAEFDAYVGALADLLASTDDNVVRGAAMTIRHCGHPASAAPTLRAIMSDPARALWTRTQAMRAFIAVNPDRAAPIAEVGALIDTFPIEVCTALTDVAPDEIPGALIDKLIGALRPARGREETWAADVLVRIGPRAVRPLIAALPSADADLSAFAAETLGRIGPPAAAAVDLLIAQLKSRGTGWQGELYARALIAIDSESPRARNALGAFIGRASDDPVALYASGTALRALLETNPHSLWVRGLAEPVVADPSHPLHEWVAVVPDPVENHVPPIAEPVAPETLTDLIYFGEGDAPVSAMADLGRARPITPDILELIRSHLDDPRGLMRAAAIGAAGNAGEFAVPLLDELLERGRIALDRGRGYDFAQALERIAPDDPRVIAFIEAAHETARQPRSLVPH